MPNGVHRYLRVFLLCAVLLAPGGLVAQEFTELDLGRGLRLFDNYCIACHAHDGSGSAAAREDIRADLPVLLAGEDATPLAYFRQIYFGGGGMPQMYDELSERDIWNIVYAIPLIRQQEHSEWHPKRFDHWASLRKRASEQSLQRIDR